MSPKKEPTQGPTLEEFLASCRSECEFLVREYGFEILESPLEYNRFSVRFRKGELEVDVYGENYGQTASCDLVRGEDRLDYGFLVVAEERPTRKRRRITPGQLKQVQNIADLLKRHASDFLLGDCTRFDSALAEWRRLIQHQPMTEERRAERQLAQAVTAAGHARKRGDYAEVVRLLEPHLNALSLHQQRMLEAAREKSGESTGESSQ
jgi:hypothetical protein